MTGSGFSKRIAVAIFSSLSLSVAAFAQVTPAAGHTPADDTPSIKIGATIFADYTSQNEPKVTDANNDHVNLSSFNVGRAYLNVTGNLHHLISFRITPDIARETGSGSSLSGSQTFRLKYAYGQLNLDDWATKGSWVRFGLHQTAVIDFDESVYRYRFQGPVFADREGFLSSSDNGVSVHWNFPENYGDVHAGFYNGESYSKAETNNQKAFQLRATVRPLPLGGVLKGLRLTGFVDQDNYASGSRRLRTIAMITFEHSNVNAGLTLLQAKDRPSVSKTEVEAGGYSLWATPKLVRGWELLLRHDELKPNKKLGSEKKKRNIIGVAYWVPNLQKVTSAVLLDYDSVRFDNFSPTRANDTRYGVKILINF